MTYRDAEGAHFSRRLEPRPTASSWARWSGECGATRQRCRSLVTSAVPHASRGKRSVMQLKPGLTFKIRGMDSARSVGTPENKRNEGSISESFELRENPQLERQPRHHHSNRVHQPIQRAAREPRLAARVVRPKVLVRPRSWCSENAQTR